MSKTQALAFARTLRVLDRSVSEETSSQSHLKFSQTFSSDANSRFALRNFLVAASTLDSETIIEGLDEWTASTKRCPVAFMKLLRLLVTFCRPFASVLFPRTPINFDRVFGVIDSLIILISATRKEAKNEK